MAKAKKKAPRRKKRARKAKKAKPERPGAPPKPPNLKGEAVINGVKPKPGMWLVHVERKRCYGTVRRVRRTGEVVVLGHRECSHRGAMLFEGGYSYTTERPPVGNGWVFFVDLQWVSEPPESWGIPQKKDDEGASA